MSFGVARARRVTLLGAAATARAASSKAGGHLNYIDHGSGLKAKGTGVTAYQIINPTTRRILGTAEINGVSGFTYDVTVSDNGEPGTSDTFAIILSNGYTASGTLIGGNIQLHTR